MIKVHNETEEHIEERIKELEDINQKLTLELVERRMMTEALHEGEQQFRTLVENIPGAVYRCKIDDKMTMEYISDAIEDISVYPALEFLYNRIRSYSSIVHPEDQEKRDKAVKEGMDPLKSFKIKYRILDAKGDVRWFSETGQAIYSVDGKPLWLDGAIFDESETRIAQQALEKVNQELKRLAVMDGLTQIPNRRMFNESIEDEWKRMRREQGPLSLILSDIDFFKPFNDNYGHQEGDKCLHAVAQKVNKTIRRPADLAARYGGEEFVVILPNTNATGAVDMAESIRKKVLELKIPHAHSDVDRYVTLSLGVSCVIPDEKRLPAALIKAADKALYEAKAQGRNRSILNEQV